MPIIKTQNIKEREKKNRQNRHSEIRLPGVPTIMAIKTPKSTQKKTPSKYTLRNTFLRGPTYNAYKNTKNIEKRQTHPSMMTTV